MYFASTGALPGTATFDQAIERLLTKNYRRERNDLHFLLLGVVIVVRCVEARAPKIKNSAKTRFLLVPDSTDKCAEIGDEEDIRCAYYGRTNGKIVAGLPFGLDSLRRESSRCPSQPLSPRLRSLGHRFCCNGCAQAASVTELAMPG